MVLLQVAFAQKIEGIGRSSGGVGFIEVVVRVGVGGGCAKQPGAERRLVEEVMVAKRVFESDARVGGVGFEGSSIEVCRCAVMPGGEGGIGSFERCIAWRTYSC